MPWGHPVEALRQKVAVGAPRVTSYKKLRHQTKEVNVFIFRDSFCTLSPLTSIVNVGGLQGNIPE